MFDMSNGGDALKGECFWTVCNVCFTDDETDTEYTDIKIGRDAELLLEALINETMQSHIDEVAKEEYLTR